jgi:murein DD-endopeptidase MepM/ murein hydrolase activator NlpD
MSPRLPMYTALPAFLFASWTRSRVSEVGASGRKLGHHGCVRRVRGTALCAFVVALVAAPGAGAEVTAAPCVGAGLVAIVSPGATVPTTFGPAVEAATTTGDSTPAFHDAQYAVDLTDAEAGAAGCVRGAAPGGTHVKTGAWSVLGAVSGRSFRADLVPAGGDGSGWRLRTTITELRVGTRSVDAVAGATVPVSDWGVLTIGAQADLARVQPLRYWAAALQLRLTRAHSGLPAGTLVLIGYAAANHAPAKPPPPPPPATTTTAPVTTTAPAPTTTTAPAKTTPTTTAPKPKPKPRKHAATKKPRPKPKPKKHKPAIGQPLTGTPPLGGAYVFPVAARADWGDSYGGERSDVPGGWHHGDDLFAPLGTPVVAVADGTIFAVGWNRVGGWRLWLVDHEGNDFYYAHLSGYTRLGQNNRAVRRGDVIGFVGNTGDAFTTQPHLHFEVHPSGLLYLGYDGAVDPTSYLRSWSVPTHVKVLPPVELPDGAPAGFGSAADFRRLLAVHPRPVKPKAPAKATPDQDQVASAPQPRRVAAPKIAAAGGAGEGSTLPVVAAVLLLAGGLAAVVYTAREGRN